MNNIARLLFSMILLASCSAEKPGSTPAVPAAPEPAAVTGSDIDPVCGMVRDSTWTDYTLYNGDTVWFCAGLEKAAFLANPGKFLQAGSPKNSIQ